MVTRSRVILRVVVFPRRMLPGSLRLGILSTSEPRLKSSISTSDFSNSYIWNTAVNASVYVQLTFGESYHLHQPFG
jgi:hypothetical protein